MNRTTITEINRTSQWGSGNRQSNRHAVPSPGRGAFRPRYHARNRCKVSIQTIVKKERSGRLPRSFVVNFCGWPRKTGEDLPRRRRSPAPLLPILVSIHPDCHNDGCQRQAINVERRQNSARSELIGGNSLFFTSDNDFSSVVSKINDLEDQRDLTMSWKFGFDDIAAAF